jgi:hypothetical protein
MAQRLVLNTAGIKGVLAVGEDPPAAPISAAAPAEPPASPRRRSAQPKAASPALAAIAPAPARSTAAERGDAFYGTGRQVQTSMALNTGQLERLSDLVRATGSSLNAIVVAGLQAGLPAGADAACEAILAERVSRAGGVAPRVPTLIRLPRDLRLRIDELSVAARERVPRSVRADLINAALEQGVPSDPAAVMELVGEHAQRLERAAAA